MVTVATAEEVSAGIGASFTVPDTAKYATFTVTDQSIGEATFTFNGVNFVYRASKLSADKSLHGIDDDPTSENIITIDTRADVTVKIFEDYSQLATWRYNGTNYSLYMQKTVSDDTITELCDLLIK